MEEELSKSKIIFAAAVGIVFVVMVGLFIVKVTTQKIQPAPAKVEIRDVSSDSKGKTLETTKVEQIEFEDPGDDEVGKEIMELDSLINQTRPSDLSGDDLSDDSVDSDFELE